MRIAEAAHQGATPTFDHNDTLQRLGREFTSNADDTLPFDEHIASIRCCTGGIEDVDVNKCNNRIIAARPDLHVRNFQARVRLGLAKLSVEYFIGQLACLYQIDSTKRRAVEIPCLSQPVDSRGFGSL